MRQRGIDTMRLVLYTLLRYTISIQIYYIIILLLRSGHLKCTEGGLTEWVGGLSCWLKDATMARWLLLLADGPSRWFTFIDY